LRKLSKKAGIQFGPNGIDTAVAQQVEADLLTPEIVGAAVTAHTLTVELDDGRVLSTPLTWYPRLMHATEPERQNFEVVGAYIRWPDLDEDIGVRGLLLGRRSGEKSESLRAWLTARSHQHQAPSGLRSSAH